MKETEQDKFDERFKNVLYDFETDAIPGDWEAIAQRLPGGKSVSFNQSWRYVAAAAVVSLLVVSGAVYMNKQEQIASPIAQEITKELTKEIVNEIEQPEQQPEIRVQEAVVTKQPRTQPFLADVITVSNKDEKIVPAVEPETVEPLSVASTAAVAEEAIAEVTSSAAAPEKEPAVVYSDKQSVSAAVSDSRLLAVAEVPAGKSASRGWGMGMGAGSLGAGVGSSQAGFATRSPGMSASPGLNDDRLMFMNAVAAYNEEPKTDIQHNTPISVGISVSKQLNNRFALQSGLTYTYLSSTWKTNGAYRVDSKQKLHYLGIPLSLMYKIAEWNDFLFYASAGGMGEINVAGKLDGKLYATKKELTKSSENIRMKELLWSVNARVGVSYPIIRFVNAFAEGGASYYFDNGSAIETVRSEKPFNASFNVGFRLGF